jgi:FXSXX-COOH protein
MQDEPTDFGDFLIDVTQLSLDDLATIDETVLSEALRRVLGEDHDEPVAGFQSYL